MSFKSIKKTASKETVSVCVLAFAKAEKAFNTGVYEEAILFFNSILSNTPNNAEVSYYKGVALVELNRFDEADNVFSKITNGISVYKYKAL